MSEANRIKYLRIALLLVGVIFIFGVYTLILVWPSGWSWHTGHTPHYLQMILGVYGKRQRRAILTNSGRLGSVARVAGEFGSHVPGERSW